ncbi:MAG: hypothetical protein Q4D07_03430 [Selenomonadaceae bacterium]|nr:hypothetical protein [Selenomonadaceae bacterium]
MKEILDGLTDKYILFICKECHIGKEELLAMDEDDLYDRVYDVLCDIEIAETKDDYEISARGETVSYLVTILGNTLAVEEKE